MRLTVLGCSGRMGRQVLQQVIVAQNEIQDETALVLHGAVSHTGSSSIGRRVSDLIGVPCDVVVSDQIFERLAYSDVIIDFSVSESVFRHAELAAQAGVAYVCCVTGLGKSAQEMLQLASGHVPVIHAPNTSIGINALLFLSEKLSAMLQDYDVDIVDYHHRHKADAPSGTALTLGEAVASGRNLKLEDIRTPPYEIGGKRKDQQAIGFAVVRAGEIIGEHRVLFHGVGECIELVHKASNRSVFAEGAIKAAKWLCDKPSGLYTMHNVLE